MALNAPKLLRLLQESQARVAELENTPPVVVKEVVERTVLVEGPERIVEVPVTVVGPERVVREYVPVEGPERVVYVDNPDHIEMIRKLQEKLCQFTSQ